MDIRWMLSKNSRSSGSILKPLLYARSLEKGIMLPKTLLPDVPSFFGGYTPKNFNLGYAGMVKANEALSMSLNIPFTHLLQEYTYEAFHQDLQNSGSPPSASHRGITVSPSFWVGQRSNFGISPRRILVYTESWPTRIISASATFLILGKFQMWSSAKSMSGIPSRP